MVQIQEVAPALYISQMKDKLFLSPKIQVKTINDRRGVFCREQIECGELIEESPLLLLNNNKWEECDKELLQYAFPWPELRSDWQDFCDEHGGILPLHASRPLLILGYGMVYNRAVQYNINFKIEKKLFTCNFVAKCVIKEGDELLVIKGEEDSQDNERQSTKI